MPVSVAEIDRESNPLGVEFLAESGDKMTILRIDRAHAAEVLIVFRDFQDAALGDIPATQDIFQEGKHILRPFGTSKGDNEQGIILAQGAWREKQKTA